MDTAGPPILVTHRFSAKKHHKLRGQYYRVFGIGQNGFINVDPTNGMITNRWTYDQLVDILLPNELSPADSHTENPEEEFKLVLKEGSGPFGTSKTTLNFSSVCRADIISTLRANKLVGEKKIFKAVKLQNRKGGSRDCNLIPGESGLVEVEDTKPPKVIRAYRYLDIHSLYKLKVNGKVGFVFSVGVEKRPHAFLSINTQDMIQSMLSNAKASGVEIPLAGQETFDLGMWKSLCLQYEEQAKIGVKLFRCPCEKKGSISVVLQVTSTHIVEFDATGQQVLSVRALRRLHSLVLNGANSNVVEVCFHSDDKIVQYTCRDSELLLTQIREAARQRNIDVRIVFPKLRSHIRICPLRMQSPADLQVLIYRRVLSSVANQLQSAVKGGTQSPLEALNFSNKQSLQKFVQTCSELNENTSCPLHPNAIMQFNTASDVYGPGTVGLISAAGALLSKRETSNYSAISVLLDSISRIVDRTGSVGQFDAAQTPELSSVVSMAVQLSSFSILKQMGYRILLAIMGDAMGCPWRDRPVELSNKKLFLGGIYGGELIKLMATQVGKANSTSPLILCELVAVLERVLVSGRETTPIEVYGALVDELIKYPRGILWLCQCKIPGIVQHTTLLVKVLVEHGSKKLVLNLQIEALYCGAVLDQIREAFFAATHESKVASRFLLLLWLHDNPLGHKLLKRVIPAGLYHSLSHPPLLPSHSFDLEQNGANFTTSSASNEGCSSQSTVDWRPKTISERIEFVKRVERLGIQPGVEVSAKMMESIDLKESCSVSSSLPSNFVVLFHMAEQDHLLPDLIWNSQTRFELQAALETESRILFDSSHETENAFRWNFEEYVVRYPSLQDELSIDGCYLRLMVPDTSHPSSEETSLRVVEQIREPRRFLHAVYTRYLREIGSKNFALAGTCLAVMEQVARLHIRAVGEFHDAVALLESLQSCPRVDIREKVLLFVEALMMESSNAASLILEGEKSVSILLSVARFVSLCKQDGIGSGDISDTQREWVYRYSGKEVSEGSLLLSQIQDLVKDVSNESFELWAPGLDSWGKVEDIPELFWLSCELFKGETLLRGAEKCSTLAISILKAMLALHPTRDDTGRILRPPPRSIVLLSKETNLRTLVQLLLFSAASTVVEVVEILGMICGTDEKLHADLDRFGLLIFAFRDETMDKTQFEKVANLLAQVYCRKVLLENKGDDATEDHHAYPNRKPEMFKVLPKSMVNLLARQGPSKFTDVFLGDFNTPEFIWTQNMRKDLHVAISQHLSHFTTRLKENPFAPYSWIPLPRIVYVELESEFWCGGFYLKNLCNEEAFQSWNIPHPLQLLEACVDAWEKEISQQVSGPNQRSLAEARKILGIEEDVRVEEVRSAYLKQAHALKHEKENYQEEFEHLMESCELVCSRRACVLSKGGVDSVPLQLIIRTQAKLFSQFPSAMRDVAFRGFPLLIQYLENAEDLNLIALATELVYKICQCSPSNAEELVHANGLPLLESLITTMMREDDGNWVFMEQNRKVLENCLHAMVSLSSLKIPRQYIMEVAKNGSLFATFKKVLSTRHCDLAQPAIQFTLQIVARLACEEEFQKQLFDCGLVWSIIPLLFQFRAEIKTLPEADQGVQAKWNSTAKHAARSLSRLAGVLVSPELASPKNEPTVSTLLILFTPGMFPFFTETNPAMLLTSLTSSVTSSSLIWNEEMKEQVLEFVLTDPAPGCLAVDQQTSFRFKNLDKEPVLEGIYLRMFVAKPEPEPVTNPPKFVMGLLKGLEDGLSSDTLSEDEKQDFINLRLGALCKVVNSCKDLDAVANAMILADHSSIHVLFSLLSLAEFHELALRVLIDLSKNHLIGASIAHTTLLQHLTQAVKYRDVDARMLELLGHLACQPRMSAALIDSEHGVYIQLMDTCLTGLDRLTREASARVLGECCKEKTHGVEAFEKFSKLIPRGLAAKLLDGTFLATLDNREDIRTPDLIWTQSMRRKVELACKSGESTVEFEELNGQMLVGGVYLEVFLEDPRRHELKNADRVFNSLLQIFCDEIDKYMHGDYRGSVFIGAFSTEGGNEDLSEALTTSAFLEEQLRLHASSASSSQSHSSSSNLPPPPPVPDRKRKPPPVPRRDTKPNLSNFDSMPTDSEVKKSSQPAVNENNFDLLVSLLEKIDESQLEKLCKGMAWISNIYPGALSHGALNGRNRLRFISGLEKFQSDMESTLFRSCLMVLYILCSSSEWAKVIGKESQVEEILFLALERRIRDIDALVLGIILSLARSWKNLADRVTETSIQLLLEIALQQPMQEMPEKNKEPACFSKISASSLADELLVTLSKVSRPVARALENSAEWEQHLLTPSFPENGGIGDKRSIEKPPSP